MATLYNYQKNNVFRKDLFMNEYVVIDIETNGLDYKRGDEITEIAGCRVINSKVITSFSSLVKINGFINQYIENLTGITNQMIKHAAPFDKTFLNFLNVLEIDKGTNVVIHNVEFDYNFICYWIDKNFSNSYIKERFEGVNLICSLKLAREVLEGSHKMEDLKRKFGIKSKSHRALNDVLITNKVYQKLLEIKNDMKICK
jgi:DNA polymerase III epsilon subunit-like protein